jgi:hypothetical protein
MPNQALLEIVEALRALAQLDAWVQLSESSLQPRSTILLAS